VLGSEINAVSAASAKFVCTPHPDPTPRFALPAGARGFTSYDTLPRQGEASNILDLLASDAMREELFEDYPCPENQHITAALGYAANKLSIVSYA